MSAWFHTNDYLNYSFIVGHTMYYYAFCKFLLQYKFIRYFGIYHKELHSVDILCENRTFTMPVSRGKVWFSAVCQAINIMVRTGYHGENRLSWWEQVIMVRTGYHGENTLWWWEYVIMVRAGYHGENRLHLDEWCLFCTRQTHYAGFSQC